MMKTDKSFHNLVKGVGGAPETTDGRTLNIEDGRIVSTDEESVEISEMSSKPLDYQSDVILFLCKKKKEKLDFVCIRSPDSDMFFLLLYYADILRACPV